MRFLLAGVLAAAVLGTVCTTVLAVAVSRENYPGAAALEALHRAIDADSSTTRASKKVRGLGGLEYFFHRGKGNREEEKEGEEHCIFLGWSFFALSKFLIRHSTSGGEARRAEYAFIDRPPPKKKLAYFVLSWKPGRSCSRGRASSYVRRVSLRAAQGRGFLF